MSTVTGHHPYPATRSRCATMDPLVFLDVFLNEFAEFTEGDKVPELFIQGPGPDLLNGDVKFPGDQVQFKF